MCSTSFSIFACTRNCIDNIAIYDLRPINDLGLGSKSRPSHRMNKPSIKTFLQGLSDSNILNGGRLVQKILKTLMISRAPSLSFN
jgi:hypothetical protein